MKQTSIPVTNEIRYGLYSESQGGLFGKNAAIWKPSFTKDPSRAKQYVDELTACELYDDLKKEYPDLEIAELRMVFTVNVKSTKSDRERFAAQIAEYAGLHAEISTLDMNQVEKVPVST